MSKNKDVRMEIRLDAVKDKDLIDFIDKHGRTRAGFIKKVLTMYKTQVEMSSSNNGAVDDVQEFKHGESQNKEQIKKKPQLTDIAFSSKDYE